MSIRLSHSEDHELCKVPVPAESHFTIYNLPFGIFRTNGGRKRIGMAIGDHVLDLKVLAESGMFKGMQVPQGFEADSLNGLFATGMDKVEALRTKVRDLLTGKVRGFSLLPESVLIKQSDVEMCVPMEVGDYTDFYSSEEHASNVGKLQRCGNRVIDSILLQLSLDSNASNVTVFVIDWLQ